MEGRIRRASSHAFIIHTPNPYPRAAESYQYVAGGSVATRCRSPCCVLMKLLMLATRRRAVLGATFLDSNDSFGHLNPQAGLSGHVHARA